MKIGKIELSDWEDHPDGLCRYKLEKIGDGYYHGRMVSMLYTG